MKIICLLGVAFLGLCNAALMGTIDKHKQHIKVLEEYIEENHLPVPAYPLKNGPVVFEIEVCK